MEVETIIDRLNESGLFTHEEISVLSDYVEKLGDQEENATVYSIDDPYTCPGCNAQGEFTSSDFSSHSLSKAYQYASCGSCGRRYVRTFKLVAINDDF